MTIVLCRPETPKVFNHDEYMLITNLKVLGQQANGRFAWSETLVFRYGSRRSNGYTLLKPDK